MTKKMFTTLSIILNLLVISEGARILAYFPAPSYSHQVVFRPLTQELAKRGHEVVIITTDPAFPKGQTPSNLTEIDIHDVSYGMWREYLKTLSDDVSVTGLVESCQVACRDLFEIQLRSNEVKTIIEDKNNTFDLVIVEACYRPVLALSYVLKAPLIQVSSFGSWVFNYEIMGAPIHPIIYPTNLSKKLYNLTIFEKMEHLYNYFMVQYIFYATEEAENEMLRRNLGPDVPSLSKLQNNIEMLLLNVHSIWEDNRPLPPNVIYAGGLAQKPGKELPEDLKSFLDNSKHGVIYVSFGTNVMPSTLNPNSIKAMIRVLSQLPYDVLWKWDTDVLPGRSENIKIRKWFPQPDLLKHPKIKLFIMQGGLQSTDEAIIAGVPLLGIPIFADQRYNSEKYVRHGIGVQMFIDTINEITFKDAVMKLIGDERYRRNIARLRSLIYDQPQSPLERAVWWTEHVLRHGGATHLRASAANMSWTEYLELELLAILLITLSLFITLLILLLCYIKRVIFRTIVVKIKLA